MHLKGNNMIVPVIMAGGSGSRLWPLSRDLMPKQFLKIDGEHTMMQETIIRLNQLETSTPLIICNEEHRFIAAEQLLQINELDQNIILEPEGRNTAPAVAIAAFSKIKDGADPILLVLAADHVIVDTPAFLDSIEKAAGQAQKGKLVTFGIQPTSAETGYGYIKRGDNIDGAYQVDAFFEKPDAETAKKYIASGDFYWNSGMFMFKASRYLEELKNHRPDIYEACERAMSLTDRDMDFIRIRADDFLQCPSDSVDYAVMEKTSEAMVVPMDAGWNDIGSWSSLWDIKSKDEKRNVIAGDVIHVDSVGNFVHAENSLIALVGVSNLVVIQTKDAVLVASKNDVQNVKLIVNRLKDLKRPEHKIHRKVYRPWGNYESIDEGARYQVKRITVKSNERLSVQKHHHRAEHWVVVSGTAIVTIDENERLLTENQSVYIPVGAVHALENPGKIPLELIEVQSGAYLEEDDIVRFSDRYGRA